MSEWRASDAMDAEDLRDDAHGGRVKHGARDAMMMNNSQGVRNV